MNIIDKQIDLDKLEKVKKDEKVKVKNDGVGLKLKKNIRVEPGGEIELYVDNVSGKFIRPLGAEDSIVYGEDE